MQHEFILMDYDEPPKRCTQRFFFECDWTQEAAIRVLKGLFARITDGDDVTIEPHETNCENDGAMCFVVDGHIYVFTYKGSEGDNHDNH